MSHSGPRIGLSDTQLDAELQNNEIDHDFFDNPCGNATSDDSLESDIAVKKSTTKGILEGSSPTTSSENSVPITREEGMVEVYCPAPRFRLNLDMTATNEPRPTNENDLVTPETCVPPPSYHHTGLSTRGGQLESYFSSGIQGFESGPHSSYGLMTSGLDFRAIEENLDGPLFSIMNQDAQHHEPQQPRQKLFDLSSSSSDGEEDESEVGSDGRIFNNKDDDEDEEFVELLEKYYDYIDLGDSEASDLTEISPMSSFTESPHPSFNLHPATGDHADPVYKTNDKLRQPQLLFLDGVGRSTKLPLAKPLPPLIIHTLEEVPIIRPRPATFGTQGFIIPKAETCSFPESLLMMKVNTQQQGRDHEENPNTSVVLHHNEQGRRLLTDLGIKPASSSSMSTASNSSSSFQFKSENNNSGQIQSSTSSSIVVPSFDKLVTHQEQENQQQQSCHQKIENGKQLSEQEKFGRKSAESIKSNHFHQSLTHVKGSIHHHRFGYHHHQPVKASATIARQRQQRRIEHENSILVRRLQSVKPSKEIVEAFRTGTNNLKCTF